MSAPLAGGVCDLESGTCELPTDPTTEATSGDTAPTTAGSERDHAGLTRITYITDPICSACWILEPAWRSVTIRYADLIDTRHVYGGLLRGWQGFHDAGNGIRRPEDVAHHWDEFAERSGQPINSSVWLTDPIDSSWPPSIALAAVRLTAPEVEEHFLRRLREELFLNGRNIARSELLERIVVELGLDLTTYRRALQDGTAEAEFNRDLALTRDLGARGFPTLILEGPDGRIVLHGWLAPDKLEQALLAVSGTSPRPYVTDLESAGELLGTGTTLEYAALMDLTVAAAEAALGRAGYTQRTAGAGHVWSPGGRA